MENKHTDWEKLTVYIAITAMLITALAYIADIKERTKSLEVKVEVILSELNKKEVKHG